MIAAASFGDWMMGTVIMGGIFACTRVICTTVLASYHVKWGDKARSR